MLHARVPMLAAMVLALSLAHPALAWDPARIHLRVRIDAKMFHPLSPPKWRDAIMKNTAETIVKTMDARHRSRFLWLLEATAPSDNTHFPLIHVDLVTNASEDNWSLSVSLYLNKAQRAGILIGTASD